MTALPDDVELLKAMLLQLQEEKHTLTEENAELKNAIALLIEQLNLSKSKRFSAQSEKRPKGTFNEAEQQNKPLPEHPPAHHKKGRKPLPQTLEREVRVHRLEALHCDCCGDQMHECGNETSEEVKIIPQQISAIQHQRTKYACRRCEKTALKSKIVTAPKPASMIPQSIASPETLAAVVTAKYADALPLYRQVEMLKRADIEISRSTLANWCVRVGSKCRPLVAVMREHLLSDMLICADETTVQVLDEPGRAATTKSYMWVYRSGEFSTQPVVIYEYQPSRAQSCPREFLGDYAGYLLCDGYVAYEGLKLVTLAGCMAHARRKFTDAQTAQVAGKSGRAEKGLSYIGKLYAIERHCKLLDEKERYQYRLEKATPILDVFKAWLKESQEKVLPKSLIGKAINYTLNQWEKLTTYLESGKISIDNNVTERDIRPFTTGRKNWLFSKSVAGAEASANLYSIVMTCRANDINPYYYFLKLFRELPSRGSGANLTDLLPWNIDLSEAE